jgi:hypothetical protein
VEPPEVLELLLDLAREAGLRVQRGRAGGGDLLPATSSGVCRLRGEFWVVLIDSDPLGERLAVLGAALRDQAPDLLETRYVPPAVRVWLEPRSTGTET